MKNKNVKRAAVILMASALSFGNVLAPLTAFADTNTASTTNVARFPVKFNAYDGSGHPYTGGRVVLMGGKGNLTRFYFVHLNGETVTKDIPAGDYAVWLFTDKVDNEVFSTHSLSISDDGTITISPDVQDGRDFYGTLTLDGDTLTVRSETEEHQNNLNITTYFDSGKYFPTVNLHFKATEPDTSGSIPEYDINVLSWYEYMDKYKHFDDGSRGALYDLPQNFTYEITLPEDLQSKYEIASVIHQQGPDGYGVVDIDAPFTFTPFKKRNRENDLEVVIKKKGANAVEQPTQLMYIDFLDKDGNNDDVYRENYYADGNGPDIFLDYNADDYDETTGAVIKTCSIVNTDTGVRYDFDRQRYEDLNGNDYYAPDAKSWEPNFQYDVLHLPAGHYELRISHRDDDEMQGNYGGKYKIKKDDGTIDTLKIDGVYPFDVAEDTKSLHFVIDHNGKAQYIASSTDDTAYVRYTFAVADKEGSGNFVPAEYSIYNADGTTLLGKFTSTLRDEPSVNNDTMNNGEDYWASVPLEYGKVYRYTIRPLAGLHTGKTFYINEPHFYGDSEDAVVNKLSDTDNETPNTPVVDTSVPVDVVWVDNDDAEGIRPEKVLGTMLYTNRYRDIVDASSYIDDDTWAKVFDISNDTVEKANPVVIPEEVEGYDEPTVEKDKDGFTITYTLDGTKEPDPDPTPDPVEPSTPSDIPKPSTPSEIEKPSTPSEIPSEPEKPATPSEVPKPEKPATPSEIPTPEKPDKPHKPSSGGGGSSIIGHGVPTDQIIPNTPTITVPTPEVPSTPTITVPPTTSTPSTPPKKTDPPKTGDLAGLYLLLGTLGMMGYGITRKKDD